VAVSTLPCSSACKCHIMIYIFLSVVALQPAEKEFKPDRVPVYCVCEMPYNPDQMMVMCKVCEEW